MFFPTTIIDGFLDEPDEMRKLGLSLQFNYSEDGRWPGKRSGNLHEMNEPFASISRTFVKKMLSVFFETDNYIFDCFTCFQLVDSNFMSGWVHSDTNILTTILYLTPGSSSGTSIYKKRNYSENVEHQYDAKIKSYINKTNDKEALKKNKELFLEDIKVPGHYNRLVMFDGRLYHSAHDFFGENNNDSRLTLITFLSSFGSESGFPITRSKNVINGYLL